MTTEDLSQSAKTGNSKESGGNIEEAEEETPPSQFIRLLRQSNVLKLSGDTFSFTRLTMPV